MSRKIQVQVKWFSLPSSQPTPTHLHHNFRETDEFVFGPPKTSFASASSRTFGKPVENDTGSATPTKSDRFNFRDKFFRDRDGNDSRDYNERDQQYFDRRDSTKYGLDRNAAAGSSGPSRKGFNRDDADWVGDRQRTGLRRSDEPAGERKTRLNQDDKWEGRDFRGDLDRDDCDRPLRNADARSDRDFKHQSSASRSGLGLPGTSDRSSRRFTRGIGADEDYDEEDRSASLRNREWRRGNAVPDKDWNRNNRDRERGERGDNKDAFFRKHDADPEWMYSGEPTSNGPAPAHQAHTQEDFQRWKERMKAGGAKAAESGLARDKASEKEKNNDKVIHGKNEQNNSAQKPANPNPDPIFDNLAMDPFFSKWGGAGSGADASTTLAEGDNVPARASSTISDDYPKGGSLKAAAKSKSSRFASIFKPPSDTTSKDRGSLSSPSQAQLQCQVSMPPQSIALPRDGFFASNPNAGPGTPVIASPIRPSGSTQATPAPLFATAPPSTTDADQEGFQRILQMLGGNRATQSQNSAPVARVSRTSSVAQFDFPGVAGAVSHGGHAHAPSQPGNELKTAGSTPAPSVPSPAVNSTREGFPGPTISNTGPNPRNDISAGTPGSGQTPTQSSTETDLLLRLMQQTKISSSSPGPQQEVYPPSHLVGAGRPPLPPGTLPSGMVLPPHMQQPPVHGQPGFRTPSSAGLPPFMDDPAIAGFRGNEPPVSNLRRRDTLPRANSGMSGPQEMVYLEDIPYTAGGPLQPPTPSGSAPLSASPAIMAAAAQRQAAAQQAQREQREREMLLRRREGQAREAPSPLSAGGGNGNGLQRPPGLEQVQPQPGGGWPANQAAVSGRHPGPGGQTHSPLPQLMGHPQAPLAPSSSIHPQTGPSPPTSGPSAGPLPPPGLLPGMIPPGLAQNPAAAARIMGLINKQPFAPQGPPLPGHPHAGGPPPPGMPLPTAGIPGGPPPPGANTRGPPVPGGPGGPMFPGHPFLPGMMPNMIPPGPFNAMTLSPPQGTGHPLPGVGPALPPGAGGMNPAGLPPSMTMPPPPPG
ncbi:hypothetical protein KEM56_002378, partial [Ascosphaera pollenicola]